MPGRPLIRETLQERLARIGPNASPDEMLGEDRRPYGWNSLSRTEQIEHVATRLLAEDREGVTSHTEMKESGILSVYQYRRRQSREVPIGHMAQVPERPGIFGRTYPGRDPDIAAFRGERGGMMMRTGIKNRKTTVRRERVIGDTRV